MKKLLLVLFISSLAINAQTSRFNFEKYTNSEDETLNYRIVSPDYDTIRKFPLVIFLHGSGERGDDNKAQLKWGVQNFATDKALSLHPVFIIAPQCPKNESWANYSINEKTGKLTIKHNPSKSMKLLLELINQFAKNPSIDTKRIYITGLSMGGYGVYDAIERYPKLFAAAVPVCGAGDSSKAATITHIPIWIFHGAEDAAVNPRYSLNMFNALTKLGVHIGFTQYPEVGHFSWLRAYTDKQMMEWLFRQHLN